MERLLNRFLFPLRRDFLGKLRLRSTPARAPRSSATENERRFYELLLEAAFSEAGERPPVLSLLIDVGCRNWSYAPALARFFPGVPLLGVEVDGWRRYWNLHRRMDLAAAYARDCAPSGLAARCFFGDFRALDPDKLALSDAAPKNPILFSFFYPFVSPRPCLRWGLPVEFADWSALLTHARSLSRNAGAPALLLSAHQGEWEAEIARATFERLGIQARERKIPVAVFEKLWPSRHDVHLFFGNL